MRATANSWFFYLGPGRNNEQQQQQDANAQAKNQARRAQVRKAQIQHRQRKANYTKELEMDVAKLRDLIEQAEREGLALRTENEAIRRRLVARVPAPPSARSAAAAAFQFDAPATPAAYSTLQQQAPEYTVNLLSAADELNTPLFQVQRTATTPSSWSARSGPSVGLESDAGGAAIPGTMASGGAGLGGTTDLTEAETDHAINFILGYELTIPVPISLSLWCLTICLL